jgi:stearoyl-CoA desaturase (delta-9 desaturase)
MKNLNCANLFWITAVHLVSVAAFFYFSWTNLTVLLIGIFVLAPLGINVGYHRLLCHRSFSSPRWLRNSLALTGAFIGGGPPVHWVAMHRVHHRFSDTEKDPHNSHRGFWYSHIMHLFVKDELENDENYLEKYAPDLTSDPFFKWLNRYWIYLAFSTLPLLYLAGGIGLVLWGGFLRLALTWHIMWFVNSAAHMWGYRNYETKDKTVNCWWVGLISAGEGWHNNHHANPSCAAHGHKWWEFDLSFLFIRGFEAVGLAKNVKRPG